ncbi:hypothetical protein [Candidatus Sarmatiella mevalonica]|uniref:hypothetical protein n=1 Tax=Candidatus Sarmatiella mevalonica TaxID=2770581 RepID=UPI001924D909|nr:hypothetical protein [Candidatus Sarmatiella mevalonica]
MHRYASKIWGVEFIKIFKVDGMVSVFCAVLRNRLLFHAQLMRGESFVFSFALCACLS